MRQLYKADRTVEGSMRITSLLRDGLSPTDAVVDTADSSSDARLSLRC